MHKAYNQVVTPSATYGVFIYGADSTISDKRSVFEILIHDITDELQDLIDNKVYTSYGFYTGNVAPSSFDAEISNRFKGNFYYFGFTFMSIIFSPTHFCLPY